MNPNYIPIKTQPHSQCSGFKVGNYPQAGQCGLVTFRVSIFQALRDEWKGQEFKALREAQVS